MRDDSGAGESVLWARLLAQAGRLSEAEREVAGVVQRWPDRLDALELLGRVQHMRGHLSAAIGTWRATSALRSRAGGALRHLAALDQATVQGDARAAPAPASGALAVIARTFRMAEAGRHREALGLLQGLADEQKHGDPYVIKLACLQQAWVLESAGRVHEAQRLVEELGHRLDLRADPDRLLALARLYEAGGTVPELRRAAGLYEYLLGLGTDVPLASRLRRIHRLLGDADAAEAWGRRHEQEFRRALGEPSVADFLGAVRRRYLPLSSFARFRFADRELAVEREKRRSDGDLPAALVPALEGHPDRCRGPLEGLGQRLDAGGAADALVLKYLADARDACGDEVGAREAAARAIEAEASADPDVLLRLLGGESDGGIPERLRTALGSGGRLGRAYADLRAAVRDHSSDPARWRALAALEASMGLEAGAARHLAKAEALRAAGRTGRRIGQVLAAAVYCAPGEKRGIVHEVWAGRHRAEGGGGDLHREHVLGNLDDGLRREVLSLFSSVRRYVEGRFPHRAQALQDCGFSFKFTKEDEPSSGSSAGLPIAMAFFSAMLDVPVPQDLAFTGALVTDSHASLVVRPVGDVDVKVEGALSRRIRRLLVPAANLDQLDESDIVPPEVARGVVIPVASFDEALEATFGMGVWEL